MSFYRGFQLPLPWLLLELVQDLTGALMWLVLGRAHLVQTQPLHQQGVCGISLLQEHQWLCR